MRVTLFGSSGTVPLPSRPLTALHVLAGNKAILIDCGEGTQMSFTREKVGLFNLAVICFTHYHPDHVLGLPGLISTINAQIHTDVNADYMNLFIIGPQDNCDTLKGLLNSVDHRNINITRYEVLGQDSKVFDFGDFKIEAFPVKHSVPCLGFNVMEKHNPKLLIDKANSAGVEQKFWGFLQKGMTLSDGVTMSDISDGKLTYTKVSYATDTLPFDGLVEKVSGADLAILEGMHHDKNARNGHHMLFGEAATVAKAGKVKELWLTHFSPSLVQPEYGLAETEKIFKNTKCGHQGMRKEIL